MAASSFLPLEQFTVLISPAESRSDLMYVSIWSDGKLNLNGKLAAALHGKPIQIRFTEDAKHLCLMESSSTETIRFPKNGSRKLDPVIHLLKEKKIPFPAKYIVHYNNEEKHWQGEIIANPTQGPMRRGPGSGKKS